MVVMDQFSWDDIFFSSCHLSGGQGIDLVRTNYLFVISRWEKDYMLAYKIHKTLLPLPQN